MVKRCAPCGIVDNIDGVSVHGFPIKSSTVVRGIYGGPRFSANHVPKLCLRRFVPGVDYAVGSAKRRRLVHTTVPSLENKPSISENEKLITKFTKELIISDDDSNHGIKKEGGINSTFDESMDHRYDEGKDSKSDLELSNDSKLGDTPVLSSLEAENVAANDIKHKIDQLQQEIKLLKKRKSQQDWGIENIKNINLRERFIRLSNDLYTKQVEKERQIRELQLFHL